MRIPVSLRIQAVLGLVLLLSQTPLFSAEPQALSFLQGTNGEYTFDTGVLKGKLRAGGRSAGLSSVMHIPSGTRIDASMGLFSHYRVFSEHKRYGTAAWDWPSEAKLAPDGSVEVRWPAAADRPFELGAIYRWAAPDTLDLTTTVRPQTNLLQFESFLASYFAPSFTNAEVEVEQPPRFMAAEQSAGVWQAFPRDAAATAIIQDGRWKFEPNPVDWVIRPNLAEPLGFRRCPATGLTAVLMSPPRDCFAILTPHQTEPHYSMYLSLFGRHLRAGEFIRARSRLVIREKLSEPAIRELYSTYTRNLSR